jgi:integrator complex subunit 3
VFVLHRDAAAPCDVQDAELAFCRELWRADAVGCAGIGRDLVRLLRLPVLAALPDAAAILADIAAGTVAGGAVKIPTVPELMLVKTPKRVLVSRIPPLLETQLLFLLRNVKLGNQRRYLGWIRQRCGACSHVRVHHSGRS